jgi:predicted RNA binding protein YcfA (HicA-like mRNA interferase family)
LDAGELKRLILMSEHEKLLLRILRGASDVNIHFDAMRGLLRNLGFQERIRGSHHIFTKEGVEEILNLQPKDSGKAKPYQVKQVRQIILKYHLGGQA